MASNTPSPAPTSPGPLLSPAEDPEGGRADVEDQPLVGPLVSLKTLIPEFIEDSNAHRKILYLTTLPQQQQQQQQQQEARVRRVRGDGCCFYRAYLFGVFENLIGSSTETEELRKLIEGELVNKMEQAGYTRETTEEFVEEVLGCLDRLSSPSCTLDDLEEMFNAAGCSNYFVVFARLAAAAEIKLNASHYQPFLANNQTAEQFCVREVTPMWAEAEQPQILALACAMQRPVEIVYVDQTQGEKPARHVFPESPSPSVRLLYRPGHYDLLYL